MIRCNRGVVLDKVTRWCNRPVGHAGDHLTVWRLKDFSFPEPPPRYTAQGVAVGGADVSADGKTARVRPRGDSGLPEGIPGETEGVA